MQSVKKRSDEGSQKITLFSCICIEYMLFFVSSVVLYVNVAYPEMCFLKYMSLCKTPVSQMEGKSVTIHYCYIIAIGAYGGQLLAQMQRMVISYWNNRNQWQILNEQSRSKFLLIVLGIMFIVSCSLSLVDGDNLQRCQCVDLFEVKSSQYCIFFYILQCFQSYEKN
jgi:hypothetical protein